MKPSTVLWRHYLNPCDIDRARILAPIGDLLAAGQRRLIESTDCPCCRFGRTLALALIAFTLGALL